jgi:FixJ family two-component response regulator
MTPPPFTVFIVDDDASVLRALSRLVRTADHDVVTFESAQEFLDHHDASIPGCIVSDIAMPDIDGLQLQATLSASGTIRPIIFLTGRGDIPMTVRAMQAGAVDFLTKPVKDSDLLAAIDRARARDENARGDRAQLTEIDTSLNRLTPRERQVLDHVIAGRMNKQIAADLGTVEKTIKVHRGRMMQKMGVHSVADLVRITERAGIAPYGKPK